LIKKISWIVDLYFCNNANAFHGNHFLFFLFSYPIELKIDHQPSITKASVREGSNFPTHNPIQLSHFPINQTDPYTVIFSARNNVDYPLPLDLVQFGYLKNLQGLWCNMWVVVFNLFETSNIVWLQISQWCKLVLAFFLIILVKKGND
jgi:hypothetical protein